MTDNQALWPALAAPVIYALIRALKSPGAPYPLDRIPAGARPLVALALGVLSGALQAALAGAPWRQAIIAGVVSACGAIAGHETIKGARRGRDLGPALPAEPPVEEPQPDTLRTGREPPGGAS